MSFAAFYRLDDLGVIGEPAWTRMTIINSLFSREV